MSSQEAKNIVTGSMIVLGLMVALSNNYVQMARDWIMKKSKASTPDQNIIDAAGGFIGGDSRTGTPGLLQGGAFNPVTAGEADPNPSQPFRGS